MANVHEILNPITLVHVGFWLSYLVLMVWEDKVNSSRMDVDFLPQNCCRHSTTLNMPSRSSFAPLWFPSGFIGFGGLPQSKIILMSLLTFLVLFLFFSLGWLNSFEFAVFEFFLILLNTEVDRPVGLVAIAIFDYFFNKFDNFRDKLCNPGNVVG